MSPHLVLLILMVIALGTPSAAIANNQPPPFQIKALNNSTVSCTTTCTQGTGIKPKISCQTTCPTTPGPRGATGAIGPQGPAGPRGPIGLQGSIGPQGLQGLQGLQGSIGPQGLPGANGKDGTVGASGPQGPVGERGLVGPAGPRGERGEQGIPGVPGTRGPTGPQGLLACEGDQNCQVADNVFIDREVIHNSTCVSQNIPRDQWASSTTTPIYRDSRNFGGDLRGDLNICRPNGAPSSGNYTISAQIPSCGQNAITLKQEVLFKKGTEMVNCSNGSLSNGTATFSGMERVAALPIYGYDPGSVTSMSQRGSLLPQACDITVYTVCVDYSEVFNDPVTP